MPDQIATVLLQSGQGMACSHTPKIFFLLTQLLISVYGNYTLEMISLPELQIRGGIKDNSKIIFLSY